MFALATKVVSEYGKVLGRVAPGVGGLPQSLLPYPKDRIRRAIRYLLETVPAEQVELREGLTRGYVYLAQFIDDAEAALFGPNGSAPLDNSTGGDNEAAIRVINRIKLDMERALDELRTPQPDSP